VTTASGSRRIPPAALIWRTLLGARRATLASLVAVAWASAPTLAEPDGLPSGERLRQVSRSVVRVQAQGCPGGERSATGFIWDQSATAVTALHVVGGCDQISVYYEAEKVTRATSIYRVLTKSDLALLRITDAPAVPALTPTTQALQIHDQVVALGYPLATPTVGSATLRLRYGSSRLKDIVTPAIRTELREAGSPDLDLEIINLDGHLLPGLSGAPILDGQGRVVAIGDGGLENGAASISWAVPVSSLPLLGQSSDKAPMTSRRASGLFAAGLQSSMGRRVNCSGVTLTHVRTRRFLDLAQSTDDPRGLLQLSSVLGFDQAAFEYDIYQELESGATVVVPTHVALQRSGPFCVGKSASGQIELKIQVAQVESAAAVTARAIQYETDIAEGVPQLWQVDPSWSYFSPYHRFDGLTVRRKAVAKLTPLPEKYLFETLAWRGAVFIGSSVTNHDSTPATTQAVQQCVFNALAPNCPRLLGDRRDWARFVLAVHLTTFPVG
jgi:hypothetical protein